VPCHNDPWPGNLLDADGRIYLIDWEYSGMNDPLWDLADLSVEARFGPEQDCIMMEAYYGARLSPVLYSRLEVYKAMSDLHWSVWGIVQHAKGNLAEDFRRDLRRLRLLTHIHRSAWKRNSQKLNFALTEFSEVRKESCKKYCN
jgi:thiamine kinase-like enzyme